MRQIEGEVTREKVAKVSAQWAEDPATVVEVPHSQFNADKRDGGFAFACDRGIVLFAFAGANRWSIDPGGARERLEHIELFWHENQHRNRSIALSDVNEWHRAAIAALVAGLDSVGHLPAADRPGVTDIARADYIYVFLRRHVRSATEEDALKALAAIDWIMDMSGDGDTAHPCPICGRPAIGRAWQYNTICDGCYSKPVCGEGRRVDGSNTSMGGGFEATHLDDKTVCDQVTRDGTVWVDGVDCHMGEAKFGGVFVGILPTTA